MTVKLLIVDDHPLVRSGFRFLAEARTEIDVVGEAASADEAVEAANRLRPDVVVMDVELDDGDGIEATVRIRRNLPETRVLFVTMHADEATVLAALDAGGTGFVQKGAPQDGLIRAILGTAAGDVVLGQQVGDIVTARLHRRAPDPLPLAELTTREHQIVDLLAAGSRTGPSPQSWVPPGRPLRTTSPTSRRSSTPSTAATPSSSLAKPATAKADKQDPQPRGCCAEPHGWASSHVQLGVVGCRESVHVHGRNVRNQICVDVRHHGDPSGR